MVKFILGVKGSGKTKKMIELANESDRTAKGNVVYIDRDRNRIHDINRNIRLIETGDFQFENLKSFYGFICAGLWQLNKRKSSWKPWYRLIFLSNFPLTYCTMRHNVL